MEADIFKFNRVMEETVKYSDKNKYKSFEDLKVWQDARGLISSIYNISKNNIKTDYGFKDQIQRASVSIMNNIAEGCERNSNAELSRFLIYAKGSAGEVRSMLYVATDLNYITNNELENLKMKCREISLQLSGFIKYLKSI